MHYEEEEPADVRAIHAENHRKFMAGEIKPAEGEYTTEHPYLKGLRNNPSPSPEDVVVALREYVKFMHRLQKQLSYHSARNGSDDRLSDIDWEFTVHGAGQLGDLVDGLHKSLKKGEAS